MKRMISPTYPSVRQQLAVLLVVAFAFCSAALHATTIPVPNGDFSAVNNQGQIGGGLLGASGTDVPIGSGPWQGTYYGVLGLLAPPQLTIANGEGTIGGIAGVNVLGLLANGGFFTQTLPVSYTPGMRYTLSAHVDTGSVIDLSLLNTGNVGLALAQGGEVLTSTVTAAQSLIDLVPVGGTEYDLTLRFDATDLDDGDIDVQLLGIPGNLVSLNLASTVVYDDVTLDVDVTPISGSVSAEGGASQSTTVATAFAEPLAVQVLDLNGAPVMNAVVSFSVPDNGAGATLSSTTAMTDANGVASVTATANTTAGSYVVHASVVGIDTPANFALTNLAGAADVVLAVGDGVAQSTDVLTPFADPLVVAVADAFGNPVAGVQVDFDAPSTGASAVLSAPSAVTDASGLAQVDATANGAGGTYDVTASVDGIVAATSFELTNTLPEGTHLDDGGGSDQAADLESAFSCALVVQALQPDGTPYVGVDVLFEAPDTGASATLFDGVSSGTELTVATDADGIARVQATSNDIPGAYVVNATLTGASGVDPVTFPLSNIESLLFSNGFDTPCSVFE